MSLQKISELLGRVQKGETSIEEALTVLRDLPFEDLGFAKLDHHRELRTGVPEIIFGENKSIDQITTIIRRMTERQNTILASRVSADKGDILLREFPEGVYHQEARLFSIDRKSSGAESTRQRGEILVLAAGTSDISVAEEAAVTAMVLGNRVGRLYDVGVAGLHRLLAELPRVREASVLIAIAGMEGALPSVLAGLVGKPIVAVPTSVGYGTGMAGIAALLSMLNSCAPGVTVVNIDNGVGAAVSAHLINSLR